MQMMQPKVNKCNELLQIIQISKRNYSVTIERNYIYEGVFCEHKMHVILHLNRNENSL